MTPIRGRNFTGIPTAMSSNPSAPQPKYGDTATALRKANPGGIDVNAYTGSMWAKPGSYNAAKALPKTPMSRTSPTPAPVQNIPGSEDSLPDAYPAPTAPTPRPPQQTEAANPLTNSADEMPLDGETEDLDPGESLGVTQRGAGVPSGDDAVPGAPKAGLFAGKFPSKKPDRYGNFTRKLFGRGAPV
jgi:hypothetical protein